MTLALLAGRCEDELICDMAETYHVLNWRELPLKTAAILASAPAACPRTPDAGESWQARN